ncbi:MAG: rod shape-determining protein MreD [Stenotrophomonas acidaminiphila]|nr:rod shape-determining protein MreD [Stenotrophomonas acidaminiphila]
MYSRMKSASRAFARLLACALCLAVWPMAVQAADKSQQAYWAGFAYTADAAAVQATTPHAHAVLERRGLVPLNQVLAQSLKRRAPAHLELIDQPVAMLDGTTSATVLAAALDRELVSVEPIGGQYKVLVEVALQALFFDFRERQVIASYPLTLQRIDVQDYRPDNDDIDAIVADLLYGGILGEQALRLVVFAFILQRFRARIRFFPLSQQALAIGGLLLNDRIISAAVRLFTAEPLLPWSYWWAPLPGMLLWLPIYVLLDAARLGKRGH